MGSLTRVNGVFPREFPWWGVKYPSGTVHDCMYGKEQAETVWILALRNGVTAKLVTSNDRGRTWFET